MDHNYRIRKLSTRECYRLMGFSSFEEQNGKLIFDDTAYEDAAKKLSSTRLYKSAGNSIVVDVIQYILGELYE